MDSAYALGESVLAQKEETQTVFVAVQDQNEQSREVRHEEVPLENLNETQPGAGQRRSGGRTVGSRISESDRAGHGFGGRNIRTHMIQEEFQLREESYKRKEAHEEELHKLKVAERQGLVKAAEENYKKACQERQAAQLILDNLKK